MNRFGQYICANKLRDNWKSQRVVRHKKKLGKMCVKAGVSGQETAKLRFFPLVFT